MFVNEQVWWGISLGTPTRREWHLVPPSLRSSAGNEPMPETYYPEGGYDQEDMARDTHIGLLKGLWHTSEEEQKKVIKLIEKGEISRKSLIEGTDLTPDQILLVKDNYDRKDRLAKMDVWDLL